MSRQVLAEPSEHARFAEKNPGIEFLDAFIIDVNGTAVGKRVPWSEAAKVFEAGLTFSACAPLLDCRGRGHDAGGLGGSDGDPDGLALPLAGTLARVPWASSPTAQVLCGMREFNTRLPVWFDPRVVLESVVQHCRAAGIHPVVACELEFYLINRVRGANGELELAPNVGTGTPPRRPANLSLDSIEEQAPFLGQVAEAAQAQGIALGNVSAEYGTGQFEVNLRHVPDPVLAADHAALLRRLIRGVARANELDATFMAKPFKDQPGNGLHIHVSVVDEAGVNRFGAEGVLLREAIAGMQALMYESLALFAPNFNSFRRFLGAFVPNTTSWGHNNRSVAFRIPACSASDMRIEHRVAGADASPHLVLAAVLAGVLHGIANKLAPNEPTKGRVSSGPDASFPRGVEAALDRLGGSQSLSAYLPKRYLDAYVQLKRGELNALFEDISARELDFYC